MSKTYQHSIRLVGLWRIWTKGVQQFCSHLLAKGDLGKEVCDKGDRVHLSASLAVICFAIIEGSGLANWQ